MATKPTSPPPAYFLSLSLENVRSFGEKQTISFAREDGRPAQWTIILGDNGVGKTTVLKSLAAMVPVQDQDSGFGIYEPYHFSFDNYTHNELRNKWTLAKIGVGGFSTISIGFVLDYVFDEKLSQKDIQVVNSHLSNKHELDGDYIGGSALGFKETDLGLICYGYGAGRTTGNSILSQSLETVYNCASLFNDRADLLNPEEWFLQMEYSSLKQDKQAAKALEQVRQVLLKVLPDITDIRISSKGHQQYLELASPYGWVRLRDMSLGYQTLVVWLTDFASKLFSRYPDSPNPLEEPAIVLIDEIDLHLHPSWQRKLIGFLSDIFKNTQFIATAHSPLVVQAAGDQSANVVLLKREGDQTIVYQGNDLPDVRHWRIEQIMSSELFDTPTLSAQTEADLTRRNALLLKKRLTKAEKTELAKLEATVAAQPAGETRAEQHADSLLARLSRNLNLDDL